MKLFIQAFNKTSTKFFKPALKSYELFSAPNLFMSWQYILNILRDCCLMGVFSPIVPDGHTKKQHRLSCSEVKLQRSSLLKDEHRVQWKTESIIMSLLQCRLWTINPVSCPDTTLKHPWIPIFGSFGFHRMIGFSYRKFAEKSPQKSTFKLSPRRFKLIQWKTNPNFCKLRYVESEPC